MIALKIPPEDFAFSFAILNTTQLSHGNHLCLNHNNGRQTRAMGRKCGLLECQIEGTKICSRCQGVFYCRYICVQAAFLFDLSIAKIIKNYIGQCIKRSALH
jgi:hypothetical protein